MKENVFVILTVARQIEGEYCFVRTEKAFRKAKKADVLLKKLKNEYTSSDGKAKPVQISTPQGAAVCICEVGAFEVEVED
jgi:hypothetical protein